MIGRRLPDNTIPTSPGEYSWMSYAVRQHHHPDEQGDGEWWVCDPHGEFYRLVQRVHQWITYDDGTISITPSIVAPNGNYHGFLQRGVWS
jgi:hypothetical protein